jgi:hypothetical protein
MSRRPDRADARRGRLRRYRLGALALGALAWAALPGAAGADNCSGLGDCYPTVAAGLAATVGIALVLAVVVSLPSILASLEALAAGSHPGEATDEAELRSRVEADAYAPPSGDPPWAY